MSVSIVHDGSVPQFPWQLRCDRCGFSQLRSTREKAETQAKSHEHCDYCGDHCGQPCNQCLGHCEQYCSFHCGGHCARQCGECAGHCYAWCAFCDGHCNYWCDECGDHCEHEHPDCEDCHGTGRLDILPYSHRPDPVFHGEGPLFVGLELEVSWHHLSDGGNWIDEWVTPERNLWYAKEDSTVYSGFEVVTHPMTTAWGLKRFPYRALEAAVHDYGAIPQHDSCGTHIHMSRAGLNGRQWWTVFALHRRLPGLCGHVGGRGTTSEWANWDHGDRVLERPVPAKLKKLREAGVYPERYAPINVLNEATVELRYPAGDFTPEGVRRNLQWVEAMTTFGTGLRCHDLRVTEAAFIDHINRGDWPELQRRVATYN